MKMCALIVLTFTFGVTQAAPHPAKAKPNEISACPSNNFEEFVRIATARGESAKKYATGKIERYRELRLTDHNVDSAPRFLPVFDFINPKSVDSKFYDPEQVNADSKKRGFPDMLEKPLITQLKTNLFAVDYGYEGTAYHWQQLFEPNGNCFRYIGYKFFDSIQIREALEKTPTYLDSGLKLLTNLGPLFASGSLELSGFDSRYLRYSRLSEKSITGKKKLEQLNLPRSELLALVKFPFSKKPIQPMDQNLWALEIQWRSSNEVVVKVLEKSNGVAPRDWRSVEYYFSPIKGVMHLVQIVDRHGILQK